MNSANSWVMRCVSRTVRLIAAVAVMVVLAALSIQIGAVGGALFAPGPPPAAREGFDSMPRTPGRSLLATAEEPVPAYAVPRYAPISKVQSLQYRMNRVLVREESWRARSAPWEIVDYYARYFGAGHWEDVTDDQFGLTRNEADPSCASHAESFDDWAERYHRVRSRNLAVRRGGRSVRVSVEPGARGLSTIRVVWAETPNLKSYLGSLAHGMKDNAMNGGETQWQVGEDCDDCPEPGMRIVRYPGSKEDARRRIAGQQAGDGWSRRMDFADYPEAGELSVWGRDNQVRMIALSEHPRGSGTDALILTVRD